MYIQDATGGVCVFGVPQYCGDIGDLVQADGVYDQFNGLLELAEAGIVSGADRATNYTIMRLYSIAACGKTNPLIGTAIPTGVVHVTGVLNQYDSSAPYTSGYQVLPRLLTDIRSAEATPTHRNTGGPAQGGLSLKRAGGRRRTGAARRLA